MKPASVTIPGQQPGRPTLDGPPPARRGELGRAPAPLTTAVPAEPCERCGQPWVCGMGGAEPCACTTVSLAPATLLVLRSRYGRCLCLACLQALAAGAPVEPAPRATA